MDELVAGQFFEVLPLYRAMSHDFPLIHEVVTERQRGQVFVDRRHSPTSALVVSKSGFTCALGNDRNDAFAAFLANLFSTGSLIRPSYLLWYAPPASWQQRLDRIGPPLVRRRERLRFSIPAGRRDHFKDATTPPDGYRLALLTPDLMARTAALGVALGSRFWSSDDDYQAHSFGICMMHGEEVVGLCYAAGVADGFAEIDIITHPAWRQRGIGRAVAREFIRESLRRGITPRWDTFANNAGSVKLAQRCELQLVRSYPFYSFNIPLPAVGETAGERLPT